MKLQEIDILCIPRLNFKVCEIVPALKPLACMYYKIPILISDFPCYREMSRDGFYYVKPGCIHSLKEKIEKTGEVVVTPKESLHTNKQSKSENYISLVNTHKNTWLKYVKLVNLLSIRYSNTKHTLKTKTVFKHT